MHYFQARFHFPARRVGRCSPVRTACRGTCRPTREYTRISVSTAGKGSAGGKYRGKGWEMGGRAGRWGKGWEMWGRAGRWGEGLGDGGKGWEMGGRDNPLVS